LAGTKPKRLQNPLAGHSRVGLTSHFQEGDPHEEIGIAEPLFFTTSKGYMPIFSISAGAGTNNRNL